MKPRTSQHLLCLLLAAVLLLPLAAKLQLCIAQDHLGVLTVGGVDACCQDDVENPAGPALATVPGVKDCERCLDVRLPESQLPARLVQTVNTPQPAPASVALGAAASPLEELLGQREPSPIWPPRSAPLPPVQAGTLLRI